MLLAVLLHLLIFHLLTASEKTVPDASTTKARKDTESQIKPHKDTEYKIKYIKQCPDAGYFFKREASANALEPYACNLCFCQGDHVAVCWKRDNRRCDKESFHYHGVAKKREKRSPGFSDIFFRDASRDVFNRNQKTQCKPFESSFSDDCPPADWCTGCTVCDCDANGHWDCHLLSFCPDDKKKSKKHQGQPPPNWIPFLEKTQEKLINSSSIKKAGSSSNAIKNNAVPKKSNNKVKPQIQRGGKKKPQAKRYAHKKIPQKSGKTSDPRKMKTPIKYTKVTPKRPNNTKKKIIKKNIATHRPIQIKKSNKISLETELARRMMKTVMQKMKKTVSAKVKNLSELARQNANNIRNQKAKAKLNQMKNKKNVNKRQIKKPPMKKPNTKPPLKKTKTPMKKPMYRAKTTKEPCAKQYVRNKRELTLTGTNGSSAELNTTDTTNTPVVLTVIPIYSNQLVPDNDNTSFPFMENTTLPDNKYYKYTVVSENPSSKLDITFGDRATTQFNKTETIFNLLGEHVNSIVSTEKRHIKNNEANKIVNMTGINPGQNGLKFTKWSNVKISNDKTFISDSNIKHKILTKLMSHTTKTILHEDKNRIHGKKVEKMLNYRKYNIVKLIHSKCKFENCENNSINIDMPTKNKGGFHGYITKVLNNRYKNNTNKRRRKPGVLIYLKGIFNKIFKGKKAPEKMNKHQLIKTLCENFGPCSKVNRKDKALLNSKLSELEKETTKILRTVKIIKGLLKLLVLPKPLNSDVTEQGHFKNDILKLNNILKGLYSQNGQVALTETQKTQIEYIKGSTQDFIESVSKFASLLNDLIAILTKEDTNRFRNKTKNYFMKKNLSKDNPFQNLRNLLLRFNLVQNTFMKQMYEQLNNFENKINEKPKVSEVKDELNSSVAIENISRNIIHNLRKLKRLAQTVSFRGKERGRTKRSATRDDDAMEYLLMMMEYLIKQNHALDAEPVNDGIDLLIEAIKNAPDIKAIKKKVLDYTPATNSDTSTTSAPATLSTAIFEDTEPISDESPSDSDVNENKTSSSEDSGKIKIEDNESKLKETKDFVDVVSEDEKEFEEKLQYDRRVETDKTEEITEIAFFRRLGAEENILPDSESALETTTLKTTIMPLEMETINDKLDSRDETNMEKTLTIESNHLDKPMDFNEAGDKKIEVFTDNLDEESFSSSTPSTTESEIPTSTPTYYPNQLFQAQKSITKMIQQNLESSDNNSVDKKARLKWIEENFGKESEKGFIDFDEINSTIGITPVTAQTLTAKTIDKKDDDVTRDKGDVNDKSDERVITEDRVITNEREKTEVRGKEDEPKRKRVPIKLTRSDDEAETKKTQAKLSAEEVMFRKQMELLNSLDYGTEKAEVFETDSKDSNVDEPNAADSFPSYYV